MSDSGSDGVELSVGMFEEPSDFRPPTPPPTTVTYTLSPASSSLSSGFPSFLSGQELTLGLVGSHPLWAHHLWNAARSFASYIELNAQQLATGKRVLELGAGAGLPGLVAAGTGADLLVSTDYPDAPLLINLATNLRSNLSPRVSVRYDGKDFEAKKETSDGVDFKDSSVAREPVNFGEGQTPGTVEVVGYIWGADTSPLLYPLPGPSASSLHQQTTAPPTGERKGPQHTDGFDLIIMSDLVFNHSAHPALLDTCEACLGRPAPSSPSLSVAQTPCLLVFYTHHRPHLAHRDMGFFELARQRGWKMEKVVEEKFEPMFPEDPGDEQVRSTVHGWRLWRA